MVNVASLLDAVPTVTTTGCAPEAGHAVVGVDRGGDSIRWERKHGGKEPEGEGISERTVCTHVVYKASVHNGAIEMKTSSKKLAPQTLHYKNEQSYQS